MTNTATWLGVSGDWSTADDWSVSIDDDVQNSVPASGDAVVLPSADDGYTVSYNTNGVIWSLTEGAGADLTMIGGSLYLMESSQAYQIEVDDGASLTTNSTLEILATSNRPSLVLNGGLDGMGSLVLDRGASIQIGSNNVTIEYLTLTGGDGGLTLDSDLFYNGEFDFSGAGESLNLNGHTLTLEGWDTVLASSADAGYDDGLLNGTVTLMLGAASLGAAGSTLKIAATLNVETQASQEGDIDLSGGTLSITGMGMYHLYSGSILGSSATTLNNGFFYVDDDTTIEGSFTNNGELTISSGDTLTFLSSQSASDTLNSFVRGGGSLIFGADDNAYLDPSSLEVSSISITGGDSTVTLGDDLSYSDDFFLSGADDTLDLNGFSLTLDGHDDMFESEGPSTNGVVGGLLVIQGSADFGSLSHAFTLSNVSGPVTAEIEGGVQQTNSLYLTGELLIDASGVYTLNGGAIVGTSANTVNNGSLEISDDDASSIAGGFANNGTLSIGAGDALTLASTQATSITLGGVIQGQGSLTIGADDAATLDPTTLTVGSLAIAGGSISLGETLAYSGNFSLSGANGALDLNDDTLTLDGPSITLNGGVSSGGGVSGGTLVIAAAASFGSADDTLALSGLTEVSAQVNQLNTVYLNGALQVDANAEYTIEGGDIGGGDDATFTNHGALTDQSALSTIDAAFSSDGALTVGAGDTLTIAGAQATLGGMVEGDGEVQVQSSTLVLAANLDVTGRLDFVETTGSLLQDLGSIAPDMTLSNFGVGDVIELGGGSVTSVALDDTSLAIVTSAGVFDFNDISFAASQQAQGGITGWLAWADSDDGLERFAFGDDAPVSLTQSNATYYMGAATLSLTGAGDTVDFKSPGAALDLTGVGDAWDVVNGSGGAVELMGAQASVTGGSDSVTLGAGANNQASFYDTAGHWDTFTGSGGVAYLTSAQVSIIGGSDRVVLAGGAGDAASFYNSGGAWDAFSGSGGTIYLTSAQVAVTGGSDRVVLAGGAGDAASFYNSGGAWDAASGSGGAFYLTSAQLAVSGGDDSIAFSGGSGNKVSISNTGASWDGVKGSGGAVYVVSANVAVNGGSNAISASSNSAISVSGTNGAWDSLAASDDKITLTNAQAAVVGGGDAIYANAGSTVGLSGGGAADNLYASGATIDLDGASADLTGSNDFVYVSGTSALSVNGASDSFCFAQQMGLASIGGFAASDVLHFSAADWTSFAALMSSGDIMQSGADTVIKLDDSDSVTLKHVAAKSLTAKNFYFS